MRTLILFTAITLGFFPPILKAEPAEFVKIKNLIEQEDWKAAETELNRLQTLVGESPELREYRVRILNRTSKEEYDAGRLAKSSQFSRIADDVKYAPIRSRIESGGYGEAQRSINELSPDERNLPAVKLLQAEILVNQGEERYRAHDFGRAYAYFERAYQVWPNHPLVRTRYFVLREMKNKPPRPIANKPAAVPTPQKIVEPAETEEDKPPDAGRAINIYIVEDGKSELLTEIRRAVAGNPPAPLENQNQKEKDEGGGAPIGWILGGIFLALLFLNVQLYRLNRNMKRF